MPPARPPTSTTFHPRSIRRRAMTMANAETVHVVEGGEDRSVAVLEHAFGQVCPDGLVHGADQACERVDEHTIRPVARAGLPAQEIRVHRPQDRQAEDGEHRARHRGRARHHRIAGAAVLPGRAQIRIMGDRGGVDRAGTGVAPDEPALPARVTHRRRRPQAAGNRGRGICVGVRTG